MRVGLTLPHYDYSFGDGSGPISFSRVAEVAIDAERQGFDSVWMSDHFFATLERFGGDDTRYGSLEPLTTLAGLAPMTKRVRLGTLVLSAPFRHPAILAKSATAIDRSSGGRLELGLGAGWFEEEYAGFGYAFGSVGERFSLLEETLGYLGALFNGEPASFDGERFRLRDAFNHPRPLQQPRPPLLVGGKGGTRLLSMAARYADGWNAAWRWTPEGYRERAEAAEGALERVGRDPRSFRLSLGLFTLIGEDHTDVRRRYELIGNRLPNGVGGALSLETLHAECLAGTPDEVVERMTRFAELGVTELIVCPAPVWFAMPDASTVDLFAEAVLPHLHEL